MFKVKSVQAIDITSKLYPMPFGKRTSLPDRPGVETLRYLIQKGIDARLITVASGSFGPHF